MRVSVTSSRSLFARVPTVFAVLFGMLLYALGDEWHQLFVPGRHASVYDVTFDLAAIVIAAATYRFIRRRPGWL